MHSSNEWMADGTKKYRKVFDRYETRWLYNEFSFFNKAFDEEEWDATVMTKCFSINGSNRTELCSKEEVRKILKEENIVYIRHSWGNATPGAYWMKGSYVWEGYINGVKIGEILFYVEDAGKAAPGENPYFSVEGLRLFEGNGHASGDPAKKYLKAFKQNETRYIWCELKIKNKTPKDYYAEFIFNYYDHAGQPKGVNPYVSYIAANTVGQEYTIYTGWGGETPDRWNSDLYTVEVVFMDHLIATIPFEVGEAAVEGVPDLITNMDTVLRQAALIGGEVETESRETLLYESLAELNALVGLETIKKEVTEMVSLVKYYQETGKDVLNKFSLHSAFVGNPGTGKTTVARLLSKIYKGLGILEKGHLVEVDREALVAGYIGQTAIKTGEKINEAMGGVLFIDEAYSLASERGSPYDFGGESIQVILKRMEDHRGKFGVIVAGYTANMHSFIHSNPGLRSRFDKYFTFEDYTPAEMIQIAHTMFEREEVKPDIAAVAHLKDYFQFIFDRRDAHFGNARTVRQVVSEAVKNQNLRMAALKKEERTAEMMETVMLIDVMEFELKESDFGRPKLGFNRR